MSVCKRCTSGSARVYNKARNEVNVCLSERSSLNVCIYVLLHLHSIKCLLVYVCMYVNTTKLIETILGSYFTVNNEGVVCAKNSLVCS